MEKDVFTNHDQQENNMSEETTIEEFNKGRNEALLSMDKEKITVFFKAHGGKI